MEALIRENGAAGVNGEELREGMEGYEKMGFDTSLTKPRQSDRRASIASAQERPVAVRIALISTPSGEQI